ncbi:MAG: hypothetical protein O7H39_02885 [Gammaproteobacteria bacterium]|nr:hypothetical protein [Gammaproteobacteria bacterium]
MTQPTHRQILIRCCIVNESGEKSVRFVERTHFQLWQYMMANKHHISVDEAAICLWIPQKEYNGQATLFSHAGPTEPVDRINIGVFDKSTGVVNVTQRFVPTADTELVRGILIKRVPQELIGTEDFVAETVEGCAIVRETYGSLAAIGEPIVNV